MPYKLSALTHTSLLLVMSNVPKCPTFALCKWATNHAYMGIGGGLGLGYSHEHCMP